LSGTAGEADQKPWLPRAKSAPAPEISLAGVDLARGYGTNRRTAGQWRRPGL